MAIYPNQLTMPGLFQRVLEKPGWVVGCFHFMIAIVYKDGLGVTIQPNATIDWNYFWQTLPVNLIQNNFLESLWYFHAQPPLYNIYGAIFIKAFWPNHLVVMHYANIVLGALLSGMMVTILRQFTHRRKVSFFLALILALNPALFLYEAYILYTLVVAFLSVLSLFYLACFNIYQRLSYLYGFILVVNLMILARSLYHLVLLLVAIPFACILAAHQWRKVLVISLVISILSVGWYSKNALVFGFFGASSWQGLGLWRIASFHYTDAELSALAQDHIIDQTVAEVEVFSRPNVFIAHGFNQTSTIAALAQDDYNNINILSIAPFYQQNAIRLIQHTPSRYLISVINAYLAYTKPSSRFVHPTFPANAAKISTHEKISSQLQGVSFAEGYTGVSFGPLLFFGLPLAVGLATFRLCRHWYLSRANWMRPIRLDSPFLFAGFLIIYTTAISCFFELGENERFKVLIEQPLWAFLFTAFYRWSPWWSQ